MKYEGTDYEKTIRNAATPTEATKLGRSKKLPIREDWEEIKEEIMFKALYAKFTQNKTLKEKLLKTNDALLIEHTTKDSYWGDGGDETGKNRLGILLMIVREQLQL